MNLKSIQNPAIVLALIGILAYLIMRRDSPQPSTVVSTGDSSGAAPTLSTVPGVFAPASRFGQNPGSGAVSEFPNSPFTIPGVNYQEAPTNLTYNFGPVGSGPILSQNPAGSSAQSQKLKAKKAGDDCGCSGKSDSCGCSGAAPHASSSFDTLVASVLKNNPEFTNTYMNNIASTGLLNQPVSGAHQTAPVDGDGMPVMYPGGSPGGPMRFQPVLPGRDNGTGIYNPDAPNPNPPASAIVNVIGKVVMGAWLN